ncbi:hypothetical protein D3C85_1380100 [compost metagenome]
MLLGGHDDAFELIAGDVDKLAELFQRLVEVLATDPNPLTRQHIGGVVQVFARRGGFRVAHPGQAVVDHRNRYQYQGIEHDRLEHLVTQRRQR